MISSQWKCKNKTCSVHDFSSAVCLHACLCAYRQTDTVIAKIYQHCMLFIGGWYVYQQRNEVHNNCGIEIYYQTDMQTTNDNMLLELFCQIISEPCFNTLRTKEQLGESFVVPQQHSILRSKGCPSCWDDSQKLKLQISTFYPQKVICLCIHLSFK